MAQWSMSKASLGMDPAAPSSTESSGWSSDAAVLPHRSSLLSLDLAVFPFTADLRDLWGHGLAEISQLPFSLWNLLSGRMDLLSVVQKSSEVLHKCVQNVTGLQQIMIMVCVRLWSEFCWHKSKGISAGVVSVPWFLSVGVSDLLLVSCMSLLIKWCASGKGLGLNGSLSLPWVFLVSVFRVPWYSMGIFEFRFCF